MEDMVAPPILALVAPCYNEEAIISDSVGILSSKMAEWKAAGLIDKKSFCCLVDDGSTDDTWRLLTLESGEHCHCVKLAHNVGHQKALFAGMMYVADRVDCCVSLDVDLQDDVEVIPDMLRHYAQGAQVVYGVRNNRDTDTWAKRFFALCFYQVSQILGVGGIYNHADFRLLDKNTLHILQQHREQHLYLRALIPSLKLPSAKVYYARQARTAGETKYTIGKLLGLALNGITSFSIVPLRFITVIGFLMSTLSLVVMIKIAWDRFFGGGELTLGWASLIVSLYFIGGLIMLSLGVIGEYIGKIYIESKRRPMYVIEKEIGGNN